MAEGDFCFGLLAISDWQRQKLNHKGHEEHKDEKGGDARVEDW
jgi:hypothetical protein